MSGQGFYIGGGSSYQDLDLFLIIDKVFFFLNSMFISVEDRARRIQFAYNYSMSFTYSQVVISSCIHDRDRYRILEKCVCVCGGGGGG